MPRTTSPVARVVLLALVLIGTAVCALVWTPDGSGPLHPAPWWMAIAVATGFGVAERAVFHLEHKREAITVSLSEVPTLYALVFLDLRLAVAARVIGGAVSVWSERRPPAFKMLFNIGLFAFETAAAGFLVRGVLRTTDDSLTWQVSISVVVIGITTAVGSLAVSAAIAQFEGGFLSKAAGELTSNAWVYALNASIAGLVLSPALVSPWLTPFAFVPLGMFWLFVRRQADVGQQLRDVQALQGFSGTISGAAGLDDIGALAVRETAPLLRARRCSLFVVDGAALSSIASLGEPIDLPDDLVAGAAGVTRHGAVCVAPLVTDEGLVGALVVADREGASSSFNDVDLARLRTVADQLAAPIARGRMHRQLEHEARHDQLTGLANRGAFERALTTRLAEQAERVDGGGPADGDRIVFVAMLDLDRFKEVNDTLGHHAGDELLIEVGRRLAGALHEGDLLARFAGDEFGIAGSRADENDVDTFIRACTTAVSRPCRITGLELVINASAGVTTVIAPEGTSQRSVPDTAALLRQADIAMYHAKQNHLGHDSYRAEIDRRTPARLSMLGDLRSAIDHGDIQLFFQPKLDLVTNVVCGAEVLARWDHPSRGPIPPSDFIVVAEQSGLIRPLTDHVIDGTIRAIAALDGLGHHLTLAMNLSAHDLLDELLCDRIEHRLDRHGVAADRLTLEITEGTLLYDSPRTRANIDRLHSAGVHLSVDDFGTGYSSLSYLRKLPVAELKIDRSFVTNLVVDTQDETIVRSTIDLGHNLGLQVVAEGVETSDVAERLRSLGCDVAQGYGICRPVSFDHLLSWFSTTTHAVRRHDTAGPLSW